MLVDGEDDLAMGDAELVGGGLDDAPVGLVRHEPVDGVGGDAGVVETAPDHVGHHADRVPEHLLALHAQVADRHRRRGAAVDEELGAVAPVGPEARGDDAGRVEARRRSPRASSTIAPAPSPNRTQVVRSLQSRMREKVSAPITSARLCEPETRNLSAVATA